MLDERTVQCLVRRPEVLHPPAMLVMPIAMITGPLLHGADVVLDATVNPLLHR